MSDNGSSLDDPSPMGRAAISVTGVFLLAFVLGFVRFMAGSWREGAALGLAGLGYAVGVLLLARLSRPRSEGQWRRVALVLPLLGAGAAYVTLSVVAGTGPVITGFVWGMLHAILVAWGARRRASASSTPAP